MTVLSKQDIPRPSRPKETVAVPDLGGDVVVQALLLKEQFELSSAPDAGVFGRITKMLSTSVVDAEGKPIFSVEEWEVWGATHIDATLLLLDTVKRLSGIGGDEKKDSAPS